MSNFALTKAQLNHFIKKIHFRESIEKVINFTIDKIRMLNDFLKPNLPSVYSFIYINIAGALLQTLGDGTP